MITYFAIVLSSNFFLFLSNFFLQGIEKFKKAAQEVQGKQFSGQASILSIYNL